MRQEVVLPLAEQLSLTADSVFDILDCYFTADEKNLRYCITMEQKIKELNDRAQQQIMQAQAQGQLAQQQTWQNAQERLDVYKQSIESHNKEVIKNAKKFYFLERSALIEVLFRLASESSDKLKNFLKNKLIDGENLPANLIQSLNKNLDWHKEFKLLEADNEN